MAAAEPAVPHFVMDLAETTRPVLHPLVAELLADERLGAYAAALPAPAPVSEPALPLLLAALHEHLGRALVCLLPEDADARDAAEAARWFLAAGGLVCASATALAEPLPPPEARPERVALEPGAGEGLDALAEQLALGGYERVDRVQERGQFAVRGGLVDVFPTTGRDPLRIEFFGDEIEAIRAFSPFTQRALRDVESAIVYAAAERRLDLVEPSLPDGSRERVPSDLVPPLDRPPELVWEPDEVCAVWAEARDAEPLHDEAELLFAVSPARRGFVWRDLGLVLFPDTQVFRKRPPRADTRLGRALQSFAELRTGDYVVHEDHGIGTLLGFETKTVAGVTRDYLFLGFRGDDRLYVPHEQIGKVSKYIGADAAAPALSKLGGKAWQNLKARARASVRELAGDLLALYARRQQAQGLAYDLSADWLERLEAEFPYRETDDQRTAIEAVKEDLETPRPMDRLVCGHVGFGKTEVAVRAAFAAALNGKQTLMLVPTTVLAEQHWNTFRERYCDFPVRVEMISRFRRPADVKRVLAEFADGKVDVLIGTHRLLSRDVIPKDLGLVIVDEEQRFGVAQKELLRQLRLEVDVLALTATPIPRTLHMSLSGLRDISIIETPPEGRRPIRTHVGEFDEELVRQALEREAARGGQAFYLHNRVETIDERAR